MWLFVIGMVLMLIGMLMESIDDRVEYMGEGPEGALEENTDAEDMFPDEGE